MNRKMDYELFEQILQLPQPKLKGILESHLIRSDYRPVSERGFLYAPGEIPVLLVAHLDTVHHQTVRDICYSAKRRIVMSPQGIGGDDRAGVFMILQIIRRARCHVLFCEDEEIGAVGARVFDQSGIRPKVNFIVELDRRGRNDAVFYGCCNLEFTSFVEQFGFREAMGSFSDISIIAPGLETAAVNISAGYYEEHTRYEYIDLKHMMMNVRRVTRMVRTECSHFAYVRASVHRGCRFWRERLPIWDMEPEDTFSDLMPLPENAYLKVNGRVVDNRLPHYINERGNVYDYLDDLDGAVPVEHACAYTQDDQPLEYSEELAVPIQVLTFEEAFELLGG